MQKKILFTHSFLFLCKVEREGNRERRRQPSSKKQHASRCPLHGDTALRRRRRRRPPAAAAAAGDDDDDGRFDVNAGELELEQQQQLSRPSPPPLSLSPAFSPSGNRQRLVLRRGGRAEQGVDRDAQVRREMKSFEVSVGASISQLQSTHATLDPLFSHFFPSRPGRSPRREPPSRRTTAAGGARPGAAPRTTPLSATATGTGSWGC